MAVERASSNLEAALSYAARGWRVLPLHTLIGAGLCSCRQACGKLAGKHPRLREWQVRATTDPEQVRQWWNQADAANVGIATGAGSGLVAIDLDFEKGADESFTRLHDEGLLPAGLVTPVQVTGSGGRHLLFRHPGDVHIGNRQGLLPGIDVRGDGGYIVAAPSLHRSGRRYAWDPRYPDDTPLLPLPQGLLERLAAPAAPAAQTRATREEEGPPAPAPPVLEGCAWLRHTIQDAAGLGYGPWYAMLSIAGRLEDGERLARDWSRPHPDYKPEETSRLLRYALSRAGPATCRRIREQLDGEPYCRTCPHWSRITSPLALSRGRVAGLAELEPPVWVRQSASELEEVALPVFDPFIRPAHPNGNGKHADGDEDPFDPAPPGPPDDPVPGWDAEAAPAGLNFTDCGNAERLARRHGENIRFCPPWGRWLVWDGKRWALDETGQVQERAKETAKAIADEPVSGKPDEQAELREALKAWARKSEGLSRINAMLALAESIPALVVLPHDLDADPWLLNVRNGTVDLRTGDLRPHRRADLITKLCPVPYDPEAAAPLWDAFLARVLPDPEIRGFVQRAAGYTATGHTGEEVLFLPYGSGRNGKSKFLGAVEYVLGDYAKSTRPETFLARKGESVPNDVAALVGVRYVPSREAEEGRRLDVALIKQMTGGDQLEARFLHKEFFRFKPLFKIWFSVNHKPIIRDSTESIWERVNLIPFTAYIPKPERDRRLEEKLQAEGAGVLAWVVRGCLQWQAVGLAPPAAVIAATQAYREEMDVLAGFVADRCVLSPACRTTVDTLYHAYQEWAEASGEHPLSKKMFGIRLGERGLTPERDAKARYWSGIGLRDRADRPGPNGEGWDAAPEGAGSLFGSRAGDGAMTDDAL